MGEFEDFYSDDLTEWEENEVFQDECLERAEDEDEMDEDDYDRDEGDDDSPYDNDCDFDING